MDIHNKLTKKTSKNLTRLLISLIVIFFLAPFSSSIIGNSLMILLFLIINLLIVNLLDLNKIGNFTLRIINGGISIFLLLAFLWFNFYIIILAFDPTAFKGLSSESEQQYQLFYYSFITITTVGYGDITPVNKFAMSLANAQGIVGLMYPAIFIARLVSLYTTQDEANN